ncbi:hypothetical protein K8I31_14685, partial [bacterium]|nr:hypothetical protein [bacterium]
INTTHFDVIALCGLFAVFALVQAKRLNMSSSIFACAVQSKIFPLFAFSLFIKKWRWTQWSIFAATMVLLTLLFIKTGGDGMRGWSAFLQRWEANSSLVALLEWLLVRLGVPAWGGGAEIFTFSGSSYRFDAFLAAKLIAGAAWFSGWMLAAVRAWRRKYDTHDVIGDAFFIIALLLICSPVCNPWYLAWAVPFLCFCPRTSWLYLTSACLMYYAFFTTTPSQQFLWVRVLEYCPFYALLIWEWRMRMKS